MTTYTLFGDDGPDPKNDATPGLGGNGGGVEGAWNAPKSKRVRVSPAVRHNAPDTSRIAAKRIAGYAQTQAEKVYAFIRSRGTYGATDDEIAIGCGILRQSVNPRRRSLELDGVIVLSGKRRPTPSNRPARVWIAREVAPKPTTIDPGTPKASKATEGGAE